MDYELTHEGKEIFESPGWQLIMLNTDKLEQLHEIINKAKNPRHYEYIHREKKETNEHKLKAISGLSVVAIIVIYIMLRYNI